MIASAKPGEQLGLVMKLHGHYQGRKWLVNWKANWKAPIGLISGFMESESSYGWSITNADFENWIKFLLIFLHTVVMRFKIIKENLMKWKGDVCLEKNEGIIHR